MYTRSHLTIKLQQYYYTYILIFYLNRSNKHSITQRALVYTRINAVRRCEEGHTYLDTEQSGHPGG